VAPDSELRAFVGALEACARGEAGALATLGSALDVHLTVPVADEAASRLAAPMLRNKRGETVLPVFTSVVALRRWSRSAPSGSMPAHALFALALDGPFDVLTIDPAGPRPLHLDRSLVEAALAVRTAGR
jgi:hypothetical protein